MVVALGSSLLVMGAKAQCPEAVCENWWWWERLSTMKYFYTVEQEMGGGEEQTLDTQRPNNNTSVLTEWETHELEV